MIGLLMATVFAAQPDCRAAMTQVDINACAAIEARAADAELNRVFGQAVRQLQAQDGRPNGESERRLREAQRTWIAYRDAQCQLAGIGALGGTLESTLIADCIADMTSRRVSELLMLIR